MHRTTALVSLTGTLLAAACGGDGGSTAPDERCFGAAQVPAWDLATNIAFSNAGSVDTFASIRLHHQIITRDTTGPGVAVSADGWTWQTDVPHGTLAVHDTLIGQGLTDTLAGIISAFSERTSTTYGTISGAFISVDLANCSASVQGQFVGPMDTYLNGVFDHRDTTFVGYARLGPTGLDSTAVADGWVAGSQKARSISANGAFVQAPEYRVGSLTAPYVKNNAVALFDSATVSWSALPVGASPSAPRIRNGRIVGH